MRKSFYHEMRFDTGVKRFRLAPMSPSIRALTLLLLGLPGGFLIAALCGANALTAPALLMITVYVWIWLRFRPRDFIVHSGGVAVRWPLKRHEIRREGISRVNCTDGKQLRKEIGWGLRVGAGGLWGGFGWLWTKRRGIVRMYVSRADGFVWIERHGKRPWLITPEQPEAFAHALSRRCALEPSAQPHLKASVASVRKNS
jgi:hypothetical protein